MANSLNRASPPQRVLPAADRRSERPDFVAIPEPDPSDTTSIAQGAALFGRASWSAGRMATVEGPIAQYMRAQQALDAKAAEQARQMARLAEWNAARVVVGGVEMTNGEAQEARQHVVDHGDEYAERAVRQGHIRADEKEDFKAAMRRKTELEDRRGRGILTPEEEREAAALDRSRIGHALDAATANAHADLTVNRSAALRRETGNEVLRRPGVIGGAVDAAVFQDYDAAPAKPVNEPPPVAAKVKAMGLDL